MSLTQTQSAGRKHGRTFGPVPPRAACLSSHLTLPSFDFLFLSLDLVILWFVIVWHRDITSHAQVVCTKFWRFVNFFASQHHDPLFVRRRGPRWRHPQEDAEGHPQLLRMYALPYFPILHAREQTRLFRPHTLALPPSNSPHSSSVSCPFWTSLTSPRPPPEDPLPL